MNLTVIAIIVGIIAILFYQTPKGNDVKARYIEKVDYWDTAIWIIFLLGYNIWMFSVMGIYGLIFPFTIFADAIFICTAISSYFKVRKFRKNIRQ